MPFTTRDDGTRLYWKMEGADARPPLVLLNSIGTDMGMWDRAVPALLAHFRLLRIDTRGHGASDAPAADYSMALLADDVAAVMDDAAIDRAAVAGVSLGGMIAMELTQADPSRVAGLGLVCTTATLYTQMWADRVATVRAEGMGSIVEAVMQRFLSPDFVAERPELAETIRRTFLSTAREGYAGCGAAIRDMRLLERLGEINTPTLVVVGSRDVSTPLAGNGEHLLAGISGATLATVDGPHIAPVEDPEGVATALIQAFG